MYKTEIERKLSKLLIGIKKRCKPNARCHKNYFDRNIQVCSEWKQNPKSFIEWAINNGYEENLEIDRIDTNKGYSPDNCRFVTKSVNAQNRRKLNRNTSGYIGIHYHIKNKHYVATICVQNKVKHIGTYNTALEAAKAYDTYVIEHGTNHTLNDVVKTENDKIYPTSFGPFRNNTSGVRGVNLHKPSGKWRARIVINKKRIDLGLFSTLEEASLAIKKEKLKWKI